MEHYMEHYKYCEKCGLPNEPTAKNCELCGESLTLESLILKTKDKNRIAIERNETPNEYIYINSKNKGGIDLLVYIGTILALIMGMIIFQYPSPIKLESQTEAKTEKNKFDDDKHYVAKNLPSAILRYSGPPCSMLLATTKITKEIASVNSSFILRPTDNDRTKSDIEELIDGQLSLIFSEKPFSDEERKKAHERGVLLKQNPIAIDGIAYITNKILPVNNLTVDELEKIFEGEITNWQEVGSEDRIITPILLSGKGRNAIFLRLTKLNPNTIYVKNRNEAMKAIREHPGSIFYTSSTLVKEDNTVNVIPLKNEVNNIISPVFNGQTNEISFVNGLYPQTRTLYVIYKQDDTQEQKIAQAFIEYLTSKEGQNVIKEAGFAPLYYTY